MAELEQRDSEPPATFSAFESALRSQLKGESMGRRASEPAAIRQFVERQLSSVGGERSQEAERSIDHRFAVRASHHPNPTEWDARLLHVPARETIHRLTVLVNEHDPDHTNP